MNLNPPKAGVAVVEGKVFVMGGLITAGDGNGRYHATAKVKFDTDTQYG